MPRRLTLAVAALVVVAFAAAGCTPAEDEPRAADDWSQQYCTMLDNWIQASSSADEMFASADAAVRSDLEQAMSTVTIATDTLSDGLHLLGPPETPAGAQVERAVDELAAGISRRVGRANDAVSADTSDQGVFPAFQTMGSVGTEMVGATADIVRTNAELRRLDPELAQSLDASEACNDLQDALS